MVTRTINEYKEVWEAHMGVESLSEQEEIELLNLLRVGWSMKHHLYLGTKRWKRLREQVMRRDGGLCVLCGSANGAQVDHIKYEKVWGADTPLNLQVLCVMCHANKSKKFDLLASGKFHAQWAKKKMHVGKRQLFQVIRA